MENYLKYLGKGMINSLLLKFYMVSHSFIFFHKVINYKIISLVQMLFPVFFLLLQVSHHPPISACHADSKNFIFWQGKLVKS